MSDFDRLARNLARAKAKFDGLAARAREGDQNIVDEIVEALRAYTDDTDHADGFRRKPSATDEARRESANEQHRMNLDKTIAQYRDTKASMEAIIDRHMQQAFEEIKARYGDTPTSVCLNVLEHQASESRYPCGKYVGSKVRLGGE